MVSLISQLLDVQEFELEYIRISLYHLAAFIKEAIHFRVAAMQIEITLIVKLDRMNYKKNHFTKRLYELISKPQGIVALLQGESV